MIFVIRPGDALVDLLIRRTRFGRHVLAVGGNAWRRLQRAGIRVDNVRLVEFTLASTLAAAGGSPGRLAAVRGQPSHRGRQHPADTLSRRP